MKLLCGVVVGAVLLAVPQAGAISLYDVVSTTRSVARWWTQPHPPLDLDKPQFSAMPDDFRGRPDLIKLATELKLTHCVKRLHQVGLDRLLNHEGWYTLFCPTDSAYQHENHYLPGSDNLIDKTRLTVARGLYNSSDLHNEAVFRSMLSKRLIRINKYELGKEKEILTANGQPIISLNHKARNGYLHIMSGVMSSVYDRAGSVVTELNDCCPQHFEMIQLLKYAGLYDKLDAANPVTFLAPTNAAFIKLHPEFLIHLKKNKTLLRKVLNAHVIPGTWYTVGLNSGNRLRTWSNEYITVNKDNNGGIRFSNAKAGIITDINAVNGVTHTVESLVIPSSARQEVQTLLAWLETKTMNKQ